MLSPKPINTITAGYKDFYISILRHIQNTDPTRMQMLEGLISDSRTKTEDASNEYEKIISDDTDRQMFAEDKSSFEQQVSAEEGLIALSRANKNVEARTMLREQGLPAFERFKKALEEHTSYNDKQANSASETAAAYSSAITFGSAVIVVVIMLFISSLISQPVAQASGLAETMATGDFTKKLDVHQQDEVGILATSLNSMAGNLSKMIRDIITGVATLTPSSTGLASVSNQLSSGARETSDKANTAASAAEEMSTNIQSVAISMEKSSSNINMVASAMKETTSTVADIEQISEVISEINNAINGIATAVEEQSATSSEISSNIAQASLDISEINENIAQSTIVSQEITRDIDDINQQSLQVGDGSEQVQVSAQDLARLAAQLKNIVKQFKV